MFLNGTAMAGQKDCASHAGSTFLGRRGRRRNTVSSLYAMNSRVSSPSHRAAASSRESYTTSPTISFMPACSRPNRPSWRSGRLQLIDGEIVRAMLLVPSRLRPGEKVVDISEFGGFRAYQRFLAANSRLDVTLSAGRG